MSDVFTDDLPLGEARTLLRLLVEDGAECPCCRQYAKVYRRSIHASMASALIAVYREHGRDWGKVTDLLTHRQNADFAKLALWDLIQADDGVREDDSKRTGVWRITSRGEAWLHGATTVAKYVRVYNKRRLSFVQGAEVSIREALGDEFDYGQLMGRRGYDCATHGHLLADSDVCQACGTTVDPQPLFPTSPTTPRHYDVP